MFQLNVQSDIILAEFQNPLVQRWTIPAAYCGSADQVVALEHSLTFVTVVEHGIFVIN